MKKEIKRELNQLDYDARRQMLVQSIGGLETCQAFVKDSSKVLVDSDGIGYMETERYLDDPANWLEERAAFHENVVERELNLVRTLSERLQMVFNRPTVFVIRGNIGAGKTYLLRNHPMFAGVIDNEVSDTGVISPDKYKVWIRNDMANLCDLNHLQCHRESLSIRKKLEAVLWRERERSVIFDECLAWEDRARELIRLADETGRRMVIFDLDVPLKVSLDRVYQRDPNGESPCVPVEEVKKRFSGSRSVRKLLVGWAMGNERVDYHLFANGKPVFESVAGRQVGSIGVCNRLCSVK